MKPLKNDILIPFDLHTKGKCKSCLKSKRELFKRANALIHKGGLELISLNSYSTFIHDTLSGLENMAVESQTEEDYTFYASFAKKMVNDWILFSENIMNMAADSHYSTIKFALLQAWEKVTTELKGLVDHFISAHKILINMGAPVPTEKILLNYRDGHKTDDCK